ncbi:phospholipase D-like domain-containing protein [Sphingomonas xanthus]|uniref:Phospholipase D n=1 Tax=Sphingomonas xanthus TaxID=2594473 RepID=A0A516IQN3_9SPHN|nr:phospholipase D-like domain-containing protein [Sphingomonas xanthus]QDP19206.1 phospholipase [Sphingomonas xanthus]
MLDPIIEQGRNCWAIARAEQATVIVDAADYYHHIRLAMGKAERRILIVGWDFDTRISLEPEEANGGEPLGRFFLRLARECPTREIDVLKWNFGALKQLGRMRAIYWLYRWWRAGPIRMRFDSAHPPGCSHHQKIAVIDDWLAACGGIDISNHRWDRSDHCDEHPARIGPNGKPYPPWHDATMLMRGPVAAKLGELSRDRWKLATGTALAPVGSGDIAWPDQLPATFDNVDIAIARTRASYKDLDEIREIETLFLDMIAKAKRFIYFENQYFTSAKIAAAIACRMEEENPPNIVLVMPRTAEGWLEQKAMDAARIKLMAAIGNKDKGNRFRIYVPTTRSGNDIYVHAKISIVDDRLLRVGSANLNNRSMGLDSECDVIIDAALPANQDTGPAMTGLRHRLLAEHLDCTPEQFAEAEMRMESMVDAIEALRGRGKTLDLLDLEELGTPEEFIAATELLDPEHADAMFDPIAKRGLAKSWKRGREALFQRVGLSRRDRKKPAR